ncbi:MAG: E3 binding domain-containing protein, partial [Paucibacter sp.]|nr:E3 binding domain-containing protein [Roseateles sp.]
MAIVEVKVPQLSESVADGTLLTWKKKPGEAVAIDEILVEIETDKVVLEVPAPSAGVMAQIVKNDGESVLSEEVIARIDTEGKTQVSPLEVKAVVADAAPVAAVAAASGKGDVAMPAAAKLLAEAGMSASAVAGTGKDGRVTKGDVLAAVAGGAKAAVPAPVAVAVAAAVAKPLPAVAAPAVLNLGDRPEQRVPMSRLRARVAERLLQSQATNA